MNDNETVGSASSADAQGTRAGSGDAFLVHIWEVTEPAQANTVVERVDEMLEQVAREPGYVSARLLESDDRTSIAVMVEMKTTEDRRHIEQLPIVRDTLAHLDGTLNIIVRRYHEREAL